MISQTRVDEIQRLLAAGTQSMRKIARVTGTSRGTVAAIAHGTRRDRSARQSEDAEEASVDSGPIERCTRCGALGHAPCRACRVRDWMRSKASAPARPLREEPLQLELTGDLRHRYEEVRERRKRYGWEEE